LRNELGDDANVVQRSLSIGVAHNTVEEVVLAGLATMIVSCEAIVRAGPSLEQSHRISHHSQIQGQRGGQG
jgi:hypothetical protein